jgi:TolB protein
MFFRRTPTDRKGRGGRSRLFIVDVAGGEPREIVTPGDASDPAWSPLSP